MRWALRPATSVATVFTLYDPGFSPLVFQLAVQSAASPLSDAPRWFGRRSGSGDEIGNQAVPSGLTKKLTEATPVSDATAAFSAAFSPWDSTEAAGAGENAVICGGAPPSDTDCVHTGAEKRLSVPDWSLAVTTYPKVRARSSELSTNDGAVSPEATIAKPDVRGSKR